MQIQLLTGMFLITSVSKRPMVLMSTWVSGSSASAIPTSSSWPARRPSITRTSSSSPPPEESHQLSPAEQHQHQYEALSFPPKNIRLEAIKSAGLAQLHAQTQDILARTKQPLFDLENSANNPQQSIAQIQEASRLERALIESLAYYSSRHTTFSIKGEVIDILGVEVSPDLRLARAYWCLPYILDLDTLSETKLKLIIERMQAILDERGGKIQALVHSRLRAYYPPKIKFVAAQHVSRDLKRGVSMEDKGKWR